MRSIELFQQAMNERRALKVIAGMSNVDIERVRMILLSAIQSKATAVDVSANEEILSMATNLISEMNSDITLFASSLLPMELATAVNKYHVSAIELGNFDSLYRQGLTITSERVLDLVRETLSLIENREEVLFSVTIPGSLEISEQISLARELENLHLDLIQTEGYISEDIKMEGIRGLINRAELTISNTLELSQNIELPIMTASNINTTTAQFAFAAGASVIACGSCINKLDSELSMRAVISNLMEIANRNGIMWTSWMKRSNEMKTVSLV